MSNSSSKLIIEFRDITDLQVALDIELAEFIETNVVTSEFEGALVDITYTRNSTKKSELDYINSLIIYLTTSVLSLSVIVKFVLGIIDKLATIKLKTKQIENERLKKVLLVQEIEENKINKTEYDVGMSPRITQQIHLIFNDQKITLPRHNNMIESFLKNHENSKSNTPLEIIVYFEGKLE